MLERPSVCAIARHKFQRRAALIWLFKGGKRDAVRKESAIPKTPEHNIVWSMRGIPAAVLIGALLALAACSDDDRNFLLTYEHPKNERAAAIMAAAESQRTPASANGASAGPSSAPTEPVVQNRAPAANPPPVDQVTTPGQSVTPPASVAAETQSAPVPSAVSPADTSGPSGEAPPPNTVVSESPAPPQSAASAAQASVSAAPPPASGPVVVIVKQPTSTLPVVSAPGRPVRRPVPSLVRPPPPPPETAPPPVNAMPQATESAAAAPAPPPATPAVAAPAAPVVGIASGAIAVSAAQEAHCRSVAEQRKSDAAANEYDDDMQQAIFDGTLKNCMNWAAQHGN